MTACLTFLTFDQQKKRVPTSLRGAPVRLSLLGQKNLFVRFCFFPALTVTHSFFIYGASVTPFQQHLVPRNHTQC